MDENPTSRLPALRQLLRARFPTAMPGHAETWASGLPALDEATGGLPRPALTEVVASAPSCGTQLFMGQLLALTRERVERAALVEAGDHFDPVSWPERQLEHLVWVRARDAAGALAAADLLARDANLSLLLLDLRHAPLRELRKIASTAWYRLQRALEPTTLTAVVLTPCALVPSARLRIELNTSHRLGALEAERPMLAHRLTPTVLRRRCGDLSATG